MLFDDDHITFLPVQYLTAEQECSKLMGDRTQYLAGTVSKAWDEFMKLYTHSAMQRVPACMQVCSLASCAGQQQEWVQHRSGILVQHVKT